MITRVHLALALALLAPVDVWGVSCHFSGRWAVYQDGELQSSHNNELTAVERVRDLAGMCTGCRVAYRSTLAEGEYRYYCTVPKSATAVSRVFRWTTPTAHTDGSRIVEGDIVEFVFSHSYHGITDTQTLTGNQVTVALSAGLHAFTVAAVERGGSMSDPSNIVAINVE